MRGETGNIHHADTDMTNHRARCGRPFFFFFFFLVFWSPSWPPREEPRTAAPVGPGNYRSATDEGIRYNLRRGGTFLVSDELPTVVLMPRNWSEVTKHFWNRRKRSLGRRRWSVFVLTFVRSAVEFYLKKGRTNKQTAEMLSYQSVGGMLILLAW